MMRGWMGARSEFDFGDKDFSVHFHPCESCGTHCECEDCCDDEQQTIVTCSNHKLDA
jgi:hypothetical protein